MSLQGLRWLLGQGTKVRGRRRRAWQVETLEARLALDAAGDAGESGAPDMLLDPAGPIARFFISEHGPGETLSPTNPTLHLRPGETRRLYIWAQLREHTRLFSAALNLRATTPGLVQAIEHTILNPGEEHDDPRWYPQTSSGIDGELFTNALAVAFSERGLRLNNNSRDNDPYDPVTGAFLFSTFDVLAIEPGETSLFLETGNALIVNDGAQEGDPGEIYYGFGDAAVNPYVADQPSPLADVTIIVSGTNSGTMRALPDRFILPANEQSVRSVAEGVTAKESRRNNLSSFTCVGRSCSSSRREIWRA